MKLVGGMARMAVSRGKPRPTNCGRGNRSQRYILAHNQIAELLRSGYCRSGAGG